MELKGQFLYEVVSGRIQFGPKYFVSGDRVKLTYEKAVSLYSTGQIKFIKTLPAKSRSRREPVPGEVIENLPMKELSRLPQKLVRSMAMRKFGITESLDFEDLVQAIHETRGRGSLRHGILRTR